MSGFSGAVSTGGGRTTLSADRTYYVRADGSDTNNGLVDSAGGAFLTTQKALDTVAALDCANAQVTIQAAAATWTVPIVLPKVLGAKTPIFTGVGSGTVISVTSADAITNDGNGAWQVNNLKVAAGTSGSGLVIKNGGTIKFSGVEFGTCASYHIICYPSSSVKATGNYSVSGNAQYHIAADGYVDVSNTTITYSNTPAFSGANMLANRGGIVDCFGMTFTNGATVTGTRYSAGQNGVIFTNSGGASYIPGSVAGSTATGGQYI